MDILRLFFKNLNLFSIKGLLFNFLINGSRNKNSLIILYGNVKLKIRKTSKISINEGFLYLNKPFRVNEPFPALIELGENSEINVKNTFSIHSGCHIIVLNNAKLHLGSGYINRNVKIRCFKDITIGTDVAISENVTIWDSDGHSILGKENEMTQPIKIGNHVWIGNNVVILKGVTIGDGAIIAAGSVVNKNIPPECLAAGVPAKVIRENIQWK